MNHTDLSGRKFHHLLVKELAYTEDKFHPKRLWKCICDCGKEINVSTRDLITSKKTDCGCGRNHLVIGEIYREVFELLERLPDPRTRDGYLVKAICLMCNKEFIKRSRLLYNAKSCGCLSTQQGSKKMNPGEAGLRNVVRNYERYASNRSQIFSLTQEQVREITQKNCYYCGVEPRQKSKTSKNGDYIYNGIDRLDNNVGYLYENCVPCCHVCNSMKSHFSEEKFLEHIKKIIYNLEKK